MNLSELKAGHSAAVAAIGGEGALRQHILDMGVTPGQKITVVKLAPLGDPMELEIRGYSLTLRLADAEKIEVCPLTEAQNIQIAPADGLETSEQNESSGTADDSAAAAAGSAANTSRAAGGSSPASEQALEEARSHWRNMILSPHEREAAAASRPEPT